MGKWKKIILFLFLISKVYSYEEAYLQIKSKKIQNDFYRVYYDEEKDKIYLGTKSLISFFRIGTLHVDEKKMILKGTLPDGQTMYKKLNVPENFIEEDEIYLPLEEIEKTFDLEPSKWDANNFSLELVPTYKLPYEVRAESEKNRVLFDNRKIENGVEYEQLPSSIFSPGVLLLRYSNGDFLNNGDNYNFDLQYGTQLLYGDFEISQTVAPDTKLDFVRLKYRDVWRGNYLMFGDNFMQMETAYSTANNIRGMYFGKKEIYGYSDNNQTIIQGQVFNASLVELYRNNALIDYKRVIGNNFQFVVKNIVGSDVYTLKIFYTDGRIEIREVNVIGMNELLGKGESDYLLQGGKTVDGKGYQYLAKYKHGITNNLTLGIGAGRLESDLDDDEEREKYREEDTEDYIEEDEGKEERYDLIEGTFAYRTPFAYPTIFSGNYLRDYKNSQNGYKGRIDQNLGVNLTLYGEYQKFDPVMAEDQEIDTSYSGGIDKEFPGLYLSSSLGITREKYEEFTDDYYFLNLSYMGVQNMGFYLYNKYNIDRDGQKGYGVDLQANYYGNKYVDVLGSIMYDYEDESETSYEVKFVKKILDVSTRLNDFDLDFAMKYSTVDKFSFSLNFTYYMDNWVYIETPIDYEKGDKVGVGIQVQKAIPLGSPLKRVSNLSVSDFWLEGKVFADYNGNGLKEKDEPLLPNVGISVGGENVVSNIKGEYRVMNLIPDSIYTLEVDENTLDAMSKPLKQSFKFKGRGSKGYTLDIPVTPISVIGGNIKPADDMKENDFLRILVGTEIILKKDGKEIKRTRPEEDGYYYFEDIAPGTYEIELEIITDKVYRLDNKSINYTVAPDTMGDYHEGLDFNIHNDQDLEKGYNL